MKPVYGLRQAPYSRPMDENSSRNSALAPSPVRVGLVRTLLRIAVLVVLVVALHHLFVWAEAWIKQSDYGWAMPGLLFAALVIYALLIAIPFVPGVEIGLMVLTTGGPEIAPLVWLATAAGLTLAYMVGNKLPYRWLHRLLLDLQLTRVCLLLERFETLPPEGRAALVQDMLPARAFDWVVKYRYVHLAVLINIPGNSLIGGGGGIAFVSGLSGAFRGPLAVLTILIATAPVPFAIWLFDWQLPLG